MSKRRNAAAIFVLAGVVAACSPDRVDPGPGAARYDGTARAFADFAAEQGQDWPAPAEMGTFEAPDGAPLRYARWTPPRGRAGTVVFLQGRTEFIEKNIYAYQDLLDAGYEVWTLDWRGQGLSHRPPGGADKGHVDSYDTFVADAERFIDGVVRLDERTGPRVLLAHSMGGGVGALYLMRNPDRFDHAVFSSPLLRLPAGRDTPAVRLVNRAKVATGLGRTCAGLNPFSCPWTSAFRPGVDPCSFRGATPPETALRDPADTRRYTSDFAKVALTDCMVERSRDPAGSGPGLAVGGATSGWLRATFLATDEIAAGPKRLGTPLLVVGAGGETVVANEGQEAFCGRDNPSCCRVEVEGAGHEILVETEDRRREFVGHLRRFVARPPRQTPKEFCEASAETAPGRS